MTERSPAEEASTGRELRALVRLGAPVAATQIGMMLLGVVDTMMLGELGVFELDAENGELRKSGLAVRLQAQPLRLLGLLVAHAGETVSREEIQRRLWPSGTHVEFDQGINACIKQIRAALGDSAEAAAAYGVALGTCDDAAIRGLPEELVGPIRERAQDGLDGLVGGAAEADRTT